MMSGGDGLLNGTTTAPALPTTSIEGASLDGPIKSGPINDANEWAVKAGQLGFGYGIGSDLVNGVFKGIMAAQQVRLMGDQMKAVNRMLDIKENVAKWTYQLQDKALDAQKEIALKSQDTALALAKEEKQLREYEIDAKKDVAIRRADNDRLNGAFGQTGYFGGSPAYAA